jgi:hypothetical protein
MSFPRLLTARIKALSNKGDKTMNNEKMYSKNDVFAIIDAAIKREMENKNEWIHKNGYTHKDVLNAFDNRISALTCLYRDFK